MKGAIRTYLKELVSVYNLVGERIYSAPAPQKASYPMITLSRISTSTYHNNSGLVGCTEETWQIDCYARTDYEAEQVKEAVRRGLDAYAGVMGSFTVYSTMLETVRDLTDIEGDSSENSIHRKSMDFQIVRSEAVEDRTLKPSYTATGAGDIDYNGDYTEIGTLNREPYYQNGSNIFLFNSSGTWYLYTSTDISFPNIPSYSSESITGDWSVIDGTAPAPIFTVYS